MKRGIMVIAPETRPNDQHPWTKTAAQAALDGIHATTPGDTTKTACGLNLLGWRVKETALPVDCKGCVSVIKHFKEFKTIGR